MSIFDIQSQEIILPESTNSPIGAIQHFKELSAGAGSNVFKVNSDGMFLGATKFASAPFRVNYNGAVVASNMTITGGSISGAVVSGLGSGSLLNIQGWSFSGVFSATDSDTVAWTAGTITLGDGTTFSISAGNTGNISALTYIYLDTAVSITVLQTTTTSGTAVGANKILVAVAKNETGKNATFQAFGGKGVGQLITADNIAANTITSNEIASNTITSNQITTSALTGLLVQASTFQTAASAPRFVINDLDMAYNTGSEIPFYVCWSDSSGFGDAGDFHVGSSTKYMNWDQSAGTLTIRGKLELYNGTSFWRVQDDDMVHYDGSNYTFFVCFKDSSGLGDTGDVGIGNGKFFFDNSASSLTVVGSILAKNSGSGTDILIDPSDGRIEGKYGSDIVAYLQATSDQSWEMHADNNINLKADSVDVYFDDDNDGADCHWRSYGDDLKFKFYQGGNGKCDGAWTGGGADYAEYFESLDGNSIPFGTTVSLVGDKIKPAEAGDHIIGVISSNPSVVGSNGESDAGENWTGKYLRDDFGRILTEEVDFWSMEKTKEIDNLGVKSFKKEKINGWCDMEKPPKGAVVKRKIRRKLNPEWDKTRAYIPREERPEWNVVGLVGQIRVLRGQPVGDNWIKMKEINENIDLYLIK